MLFWWTACVNTEPPACDPTSMVERFADADGDGYGGEALGRACELGPGEVADPLDCDDADPDVHPDAEETCDGRDEDCDGAPDEGLPTKLWLQDLDGDGYGGRYEGVLACTSPGEGWVREGGDCDDEDPDRSPGAVEVCNDHLDDDCDGFEDDLDDTLDLTTRAIWYRDADGDGWGNEEITRERCGPPQGYVERPGDCDDADPTFSRLDAWVDRDRDGYGDPKAPRSVCELADRLADNPLDCDDTDPTVLLASDWLADADGDGVGAGAAISQGCVAPPNSAPDWAGVDCAPNDPTIFPGAEEICENGVDEDCNGFDDLCEVLQTWPVGDDEERFSGPNRFRGNLFHATTEGRIDGFGMDLDLVAGCTLDWYVHHSDVSGTGPFEVLFAGQTTVSGGKQTYASPVVDIPIVPGDWYGLGAAWTCSTTYTRTNSSTDWVGVDCGVGDFETWYYHDSYPGFSPTYVPPSTSTLTRAYHGEVHVWRPL
ncbi:MAG: putative metal-binding motif-containing protein [Alphaproteobacteria bacterium]|nr:putative metal-binding motif-containing protein [Alphaproteobacteria bacterium]MCB9697538.1 putative metal-binding motif-containing protein [Alphaproteobacteria bacterium]